MTPQPFGQTRAPRAASRPVTGYTAPGQAMVPEWDAATAIRLAFLANVIVYRCVTIIADTIASLPFRAGPDPDRRSRWDRRAPLARLLGPAPGGPAPDLPARMLWRWSIAQRIVTGRHAWELELGPAGQVQAIWPLVSANLQAIPTTSGTEWFRSFQYGPSHDPVTLAAERVFYGWDPSPTDFRQPMSALQAARLPISVAQMVDRYNYGFLRNDARPAAIVVTEAFAEDSDFERFRSEWQGEYRGPENSGKIALLEADPDSDVKPSEWVAVHSLGVSQKDARLFELHRDALVRVAAVLGVPWSRIDASGRTFDNADAEERAFYSQTIMPWVATLEDEVNLRLAERIGTDAGWFDLAGVKVLAEQADPVTARAGAPSLVQAQLMTINEARADYGLPPMPDGDRVMTAEEIAALHGAGAPIPPVVEPAADTDDGDDEPRSAAPETRTVDPVEVEVRRTRVWRRADAQMTTLETRWVNALGRLFSRQSRSVIAALEGKRGVKLLSETRDAADAADVERIFRRPFWVAETSTLAEDLYEAVVAAGADRIVAGFGVSFDLGVGDAQSFVTSRANQLAGRVTDTTYIAIRDTLAAGVEAGESVPALAQRIRDVFTEATTRRATVIARTEVPSAFNGAATLAASQLPSDVAAGLEWIATRDGRTRPAHSTADGQRVRTGESFTVAGEALSYPGDPAGSAANVVQCRCTVAVITPEEWVADVRAAGPVLVPDTVARLLMSTVRTPDDAADLRRVALNHLQEVA